MPMQTAPNLILPEILLSANATNRFNIQLEDLAEPPVVFDPTQYDMILTFRYLSNEGRKALVCSTRPTDAEEGVPFELLTVVDGKILVDIPPSALTLIKQGQGVYDILLITKATQEYVRGGGMNAYGQFYLDKGATNL